MCIVTLSKCAQPTCGSGKSIYKESSCCNSPDKLYTAPAAWNSYLNFSVCGGSYKTSLPYMPSQSIQLSGVWTDLTGNNMLYGLIAKFQIEQIGPIILRGVQNCPGTFFLSWAMQNKIHPTLGVESVRFPDGFFCLPSVQVLMSALSDLFMMEVALGYQFGQEDSFLGKPVAPYGTPTFKPEPEAKYLKYTSEDMFAISKRVFNALEWITNTTQLSTTTHNFLMAMAVNHVLVHVDSVYELMGTPSSERFQYIPTNYDCPELISVLENSSKVCSSLCGVTKKDGYYETDASLWGGGLTGKMEELRSICHVPTLSKEDGATHKNAIMSFISKMRKYLSDTLLSGGNPSSTVMLA